MELVTSGDFIYTESGKKASIMGISEDGKKKDTLVFQTKLDEYRVTSIGTQTFNHRYLDNLDITNPNVYFCNAYTYKGIYMKYALQKIFIFLQIMITVFQGKKHIMQMFF